MAPPRSPPIFDTRRYRRSDAFRMTDSRALLSLHLTAVLFGLTGVLGHVINADAAQITFWRAAFAVAALLVTLHLGKRAVLFRITRRQLVAVVLSGVMLATHWLTFFISVKVAGIAIATLGFTSFPAFITLFEAVLFRERVRLPEWGMVALVSLGLVLLTPAFDLADSGTVGLLWGLASGASFGMLAVINRHAGDGLGALEMACGQNIVVALVTAPFALGASSGLAMADWLGVAALGILCTGLAHTLFVSSLEYISARRAGLIIALEPLYAIAFAWLLFGDVPGWRVAMGAACIVGAIAWSASYEKRPAGPPATPI